MKMKSEISGCWDEPLETTLAVLSEGWATIDELIAANLVRRGSRPAIGTLAIRMGMLTSAEVSTVLNEQNQTGENFGKLAVRLGYLQEEELDSLLHEQASITPTFASVLVKEGILSVQQAALVRQKLAEQVRIQRELWRSQDNLAATPVAAVPSSASLAF